MDVRAKVTQYTRIDVRISVQLHFDYQEKRLCATDPIEAHFQYHFTHFLTALPLAGRGAGVDAFAFGAVLALDTGAFAPALAFAAGAGAIRLGCGVLGLLIGFGAGFGFVLLLMPRG